MRIPLIVLALILSACSTTSGIPKGAVAWCGNFEYTGTVTKSHAEGDALGVSNAAMAERMSIDDMIKLAESMGCGR